MNATDEVEVKCILKERGKPDRETIVLMPRHAAERFNRGERA